MSSASSVLHTYLSELAARGVTHVPLNEQARKLLAGRPQATPQRPSSPSPVTSPSVSQATGRSAGSAQEHSAAATTSPRPPLEGRAASSPVTPSSPKVPASPQDISKRELLTALAVEAEGSRQARELGTLREVMVFATGSPDADIMFIGEAPGAEEEKQQEPFVGPAGQLLTKIIQAMGLRRTEVYITNVCKFRPKIGDGNMQGSKNRAPTLGEMLSCQSYILAEINIIKPRAIVCLGATAAAGLGLEGTVGKLRGSLLDWRGTPLAVTYHPSYLLRRESEDGGGLIEKRLVWEDMMRVMHAVGLPISDKQKAYFSKAR